jgi:hypothetical protein
MLYEGLKQNSTIVLVPSSALDTMQLGDLAGITALTMKLSQNRTNTEKEGNDASTPAPPVEVPNAA